jgi:hypothetical protein
MTVKAIQCNNGREFDNSSTRFFLLSNGTQLQTLCPYTSPQNGKAERIIRSVNNIICTLLIQASLSGRYWAEGLHTTTYLLNRLSGRSRLCVLILSCLVPHPPMSICMSLVVRAALTRLPLGHISSPHAPQRLLLHWSLDKPSNRLSICGFWWGQLPSLCLAQSNWPTFSLWVGSHGFHNWDTPHHCRYLSSGTPPASTEDTSGLWAPLWLTHIATIW